MQTIFDTLSGGLQVGSLLLLGYGAILAFGADDVLARAFAALRAAPWSHRGRALGLTD